MFEKFTDRARRILVLAAEEARLLRHPYLGSEHLLLGIMREADNLGYEVLHELGITLDNLRSQVAAIAGDSGLSVPSGHILFTAEAKAGLERSNRISLRLRRNYIAPEHILLGLIPEDDDNFACKVLLSLGCDPAVVHVLTIELEGRTPAAAPPPPPPADFVSISFDGQLLESAKRKYWQLKLVLASREIPVMDVFMDTAAGLGDGERTMPREQARKIQRWLSSIVLLTSAAPDTPLSRLALVFDDAPSK
jgi:ATP-dependent Clp protease ATP-binding subunit ClpA